MVTVSGMSTEPAVNPRSARGNQGCWPCRFRKKKCQRSNESEPICDDCQRFHIVCNGAGEERPRRAQLSQDVRNVIKDWIKARQKDEGKNYTGPPLSLDYLWTTTQPAVPRPASSNGSNTETRSSPYNVQSHQRRRSGSNIPSETTSFGYNYPTSNYLQPPSTTSSAISTESINHQGRVATGTYPHSLPIPTPTSRAPGHMRRATTDAIPHIAISEPQYSQSTGYLPYTSGSQSSSPSSMEYLPPQFHDSQTRTTTLGISQPSNNYAPSLSLPPQNTGVYAPSTSRLSVPAPYPSQSSSSYFQAASRSTPSINIVVADPPNPTHSPQTALAPSWDASNPLNSFDFSTFTNLLVPGSPLTPNSPHASSFTSFNSDEHWGDNIPSPSAYPELYLPEETQEPNPSSWPGLPAPSASQSTSQQQSQAQQYQQQQQHHLQQQNHYYQHRSH